jgi:hypothetical protein
MVQLQNRSSRIFVARRVPGEREKGIVIREVGVSGDALSGCMESCLK